MVHVTSEVHVAQSCYLDNQQEMVQYDVDHSVRILIAVDIRQIIYVDYSVHLLFHTFV